MYDSTTQLNNALKVFEKAGTKLEQAVVKAEAEQRKAREKMEEQQRKIDEAQAAQAKATTVLTNIKALLGES